jgi:hypothetical protein
MGYGMYKKVHLFWGRSRPLSWLRLQTVKTFAKLNPYWQIVVWYREDENKAPAWESHEQKVQYIGKDYFHELTTIPQVAIYEAPWTEIELSDIHFSDYFRWWILSVAGGLWSDFDIVYTKPMSALPTPPGPFLIKYPEQNVWPIGFLGAFDDEAISFFCRVEGEAQQHLESAVGYQDLGCVLLERVTRRFKMFPQKPICIYPEFIMRKVQSAFFTPNSPYCLHKKTIGFHWYAGASFATEFENSIADPDFLTGEQKSTGIIRAIESVLL